MANTHIVITTIYKFSYSNYSDILHSYNHSKISKYTHILRPGQGIYSF